MICTCLQPSPAVLDRLPLVAQLSCGICGGVIVRILPAAFQLGRYERVCVQIDPVKVRRERKLDELTELSEELVS